MFVNMLYDMPSWLLGLSIITVTTGIGILGLFMVGRLSSNQSRELNNEIVLGIGHLGGILFAIVLGFVAIAVWGQYDKAGLLVENESNAAFTIWVDSRAYPGEYEAQVRNGIEKYLSTVINEEWSLQQHGKVDENANQAFENLYRLLIDYTPKTEAQRIVHAEVLHKVNDLFSLRRSRIFINTHGLEPSVYYVIIISTIITLGFAWSFGSKFPQGHLILTAMLSAGIGLVLFLIITFDWPFRGEVSISSQAFQTVLEHIERLKIEQPISKGI